MTQIIIGKCPSKSNCYKVIQLGKHASLAKTKALTDYEKSFYLQCNIYRNKNITGLFEIHLHVYYDSNRADLDNSLKIILDCLQKVNAIKNDNNCVKIIAEKFIDKIKPRIEFTLKPIQYFFIQNTHLEFIILSLIVFFLLNLTVKHTKKMIFNYLEHIRISLKHAAELFHR